MPEISRFYGIIIRLFYNDHNSPYFHAIYQDDKAVLDIKTLEILEDTFTKTSDVLSHRVAIEHKEELVNNW